MRDDVFPEDVNAVKGVGDVVIVGEAEGEAAGVDGAREAEAVAGDGDGGAEVELDGVVELVGVDAVDLGDVIVAVGGEKQRRARVSSSRAANRSSGGPPPAGCPGGS